MDDWIVWTALGALALVLWQENVAAQVVAAAGLFDPAPLDSSGSAIDMTQTHDDALAPSLYDLAQAIARAEGYGVPGAVPTRANNPGDLVPPNWTGDTANSAGVAVFRSPDEGWAALYHQLALILSGRSHVYAPTDTIAQLAAKWTGGDQSDAWAANVVSALQAKGHAVSTDTMLADVVNA